MKKYDSEFYQWLTLTKSYIDDKQIEQKLGETLINSQILNFDESSILSFFEYIDNNFTTREQTNYWAEKFINKDNFVDILFTNRPGENLVNTTLLKWQIEKIVELPEKIKREIYQQNLIPIKNKGVYKKEVKISQCHHNFYNLYKKTLTDSRIIKEDRSLNIIEDMKSIFNEDELEVLLIPQLFQSNSMDWCIENYKEYDVLNKQNLKTIFSERFVENKLIDIENFIKAIKNDVPKDLKLDNQTIIDIYLKQELAFIADSLNTNFKENYANEARIARINKLNNNLEELKEFGLEFIDKEILNQFNKRVDLKKIEKNPQIHNDYLTVTLLLKKIEEKTTKRKVLKI